MDFSKFFCGEKKTVCMYDVILHLAFWFHNVTLDSQLIVGWKSEIQKFQFFTQRLSSVTGKQFSSKIMQR